jgi:hypothetical protein
MLSTAEPAETDQSGHDHLAQEPTRRGFLGWLGRLGIVVVGSAAGVTAIEESASADGRCVRFVACCCLKRLTTCSGCRSPGSGSTIVCPGGSVKRIWYCCAGGRQYGCAECTRNGTTCQNTTNAACSCAFRTGRNCG